MFLSYFYKLCQRISKNDVQSCDTQKKEEDHYLNEQIVIEQ